MAFLVVEFLFANGTGILIKAYKPRIEESDFTIKNYITNNVKFTQNERPKQDDLDSLKVQLDTIVLDHYGFYSYDLTCFDKDFGVGITSLGFTAGDRLQMARPQYIKAQEPRNT